MSVYSRAQSRFVLRPQRQAKTFSYVAELLTAMLERRRAVDVATPRPMSASDPRIIHPYVNRGSRPTPEEVRELQVQREAHRRFP